MRLFTGVRVWNKARLRVEAPFIDKTALKQQSLMSVLRCTVKQARLGKYSKLHGPPHKAEIADGSLRS